MTLDTYTPQHPKRVFLQHLTRDNAAGRQTVYAVASSDATDVSIALKGMQLTELDSLSNEWLVSALSKQLLIAISALQFNANT